MLKIQFVWKIANGTISHSWSQIFLHSLTLFLFFVCLVQNWGQVEREEGEHGHPAAAGMVPTQDKVLRGEGANFTDTWNVNIIKRRA